MFIFSLQLYIVSYITLTTMFFVFLHPTWKGKIVLEKEIEKIPFQGSILFILNIIMLY